MVAACSSKQLVSFLEITPETICRMKRFRYEQAKQTRQTELAYSKYQQVT